MRRTTERSLTTCTLLLHVVCPESLSKVQLNLKIEKAVFDVKESLFFLKSDTTFRQGVIRHTCQTTTGCLPFTGWY